MSLEIGSAETHGAWLRPASGFPTCGKGRDAAPARTEPNSKAETTQRTEQRTFLVLCVFFAYAGFEGAPRRGRVISKMGNEEGGLLRRPK